MQFVHKIGKASIDSNRVEVPFTQIAPGNALQSASTLHALVHCPPGSLLHSPAPLTQSESALHAPPMALSSIPTANQ